MFKPLEPSGHPDHQAARHVSAEGGHWQFRGRFDRFPGSAARMQFLRHLLHFRELVTLAKKTRGVVHIDRK